jgi:hypothetical protein
MCCRMGPRTTKTQATASPIVFTRHLPIVGQAFIIFTRKARPMSLSYLILFHDDLLTQYSKASYSIIAL